VPQTSLTYRAISRAAVAALPLVAFGSAKLRAGHRGRQGPELAEWGRRHRDQGRPLAWFHASSVGEGLQAGSVIDALRTLRPDCQILFTHFSPSAEPLAKRLRVDAHGYIPYDLPGDVDRLLDALRPDLLVFSKLDLWPELATRAAARGVPVTIVAGTVSPGSGRLRWPARALLAPGYASVAAAGAIAEPDAERLAHLGVPRDAIRVLGDPRFDSVTARVRATAGDDPLLRLGRGAPTLVAGSTWRGDDRVLLEAFARISASYPDARLIIAPHEPTHSHLAALESRAIRAGLGHPVRLSEAKEPSRLVIVDSVGVLATLYGAGTMAYVGGGFGRAGLHSVLEPAAWGLPVAFGPRWRDSRDAGLLIESGAATAVDSSRDMRQVWQRWLNDEPGRSEEGRRARAVVNGGLGAASRSAEMLADFISLPRPRT
jgi:3-deoxy-D-manno-octulosonic-acid transferase